MLFLSSLLIFDHDHLCGDLRCARSALEPRYLSAHIALLHTLLVLHVHDTPIASAPDLHVLTLALVSHPGTAQPAACDAAADAAADADATTPQQRSAPFERVSLQRPAVASRVWCGDQSAGPRSPALAFGREVSQRPETFHAARFGRYPAQPQQQTRWRVTAAERTPLPTPGRLASRLSSRVRLCLCAATLMSRYTLYVDACRAYVRFALHVRD